MTNSLVILGAGGHARVVADAARLLGWHVAGYIDSTASAEGASIDGQPVWVGKSPLETARRATPDSSFIVAIGRCKARLDWFGVLADSRLRSATIIHPRATIATSARLGEGCFVAAGAVVGPSAVLGPACVVNTAATVDHDCTVGAGVHIAPGAHLGGWVVIGDLSWIGIGATVSDRSEVGERTLIGAGAVVIGTLPPGCVAYGVPARLIRNAEPEDIHLGDADFG